MEGTDQKEPFMGLLNNNDYIDPFKGSDYIDPSSNAAIKTASSPFWRSLSSSL